MYMKIYFSCRKERERKTEGKENEIKSERKKNYVQFSHNHFKTGDSCPRLPSGNFPGLNHLPATAGSVNPPGAEQRHKAGAGSAASERRPTGPSRQLPRARASRAARGQDHSNAT